MINPVTVKHKLDKAGKHKILVFEFSDPDYPILDTQHAYHIITNK